MRRTIAILSAAGLLASCAGQGARVEGNIGAGGARKTLLVEEILPGRTQVIDSLRTDGNGKFTYRIKKELKTPVFYAFRLSDAAGVPLLLGPGERVRVEIADSTCSRYEVSGSEGSALVKEANELLHGDAARMLTLEQAYADTDDPDQLTRIATEYSGLQVSRKQAAAAFLARNAGSLATVVPLYQTTADGALLFTEPEDALYYRMVSDSLLIRYPLSPYAAALQNDARQIEEMIAAEALLEAHMDNEIDFPEIDMLDILGKRHRLTDLKGKVILLSFTASDVPQLNILNRELVEVYERHAPQGFEVYQVFLDTDKAAWISRVAGQRLPWITVSDLRGGDSPVVKTYNVQRIPSNYLIDREGNILSRDLAPSDIERAVARAL